MIYIHYRSEACSIRVAVDMPMLTALSQLLVAALHFIFLRQA